MHFVSRHITNVLKNDNLTIWSHLLQKKIPPAEKVTTIIFLAKYFFYVYVFMYHRNSLKAYSNICFYLLLLLCNKACIRVLLLLFN